MKRGPMLKKIRTAYGVSEYRLPNGLRLLFKRERAAPVVAVCITFHVGSRNEAPGHTGSTHILEHLLFKDSKKYNRKNGKAITDYLEWFGAYINATTWFDRTNYFELLPKERLEEALALEADRLRGSLFCDADLAAEMTVVRNEYERSRNNPFELLDEEMWSAAFTTHPYRIPTIGLKEDIEGSTAKKLREFYDTFYWPNNATLSVFGDVEWKNAERMIQEHFGPIPASPRPIPELSSIEPAQKSGRSVKLAQPLGIRIASVAYKIPPATHSDFPAIVMLGMVLAGGFASRLQRALVDPGLVAELHVSALPLRDPGLAAFTAHLAKGSKPQRVLSVLRKEIGKIARSAPSKGEVARAKERILADIAVERDGIFNEIRAVSEAVAAGDWTFGYRMEELIKKVRPADIRRVAKTYFVPSQETSGILEEKK